jgi:hypothetical protein
MHSLESKRRIANSILRELGIRRLHRRCVVLFTEADVLPTGSGERYSMRLASAFTLDAIRPDTAKDQNSGQDSREIPGREGGKRRHSWGERVVAHSSAQRYE